MSDLMRMRRAAREIFDAALSELDAGEAVRRALSLEGNQLRIHEEEFGPLDAWKKVYAVAIGKAAIPMALALEERLGERLARGVISAPRSQASLHGRWCVFEGGHPLPNLESLAAGDAAFRLLREADDDSSLIIFLISGGGSAMLERPLDKRVTLEDLRETNRVLVTCGAPISEINAVRRALSAVKGGGLSVAAPRARQVSLIVSDTASGREADVASGPTLMQTGDAAELADIIERYDLAARLPASCVRALEKRGTPQTRELVTGALRSHFVLLDNESARRAAAEAARLRGFLTEVARDLEEQRVDEGAFAAVSRLAELYRRAAVEKAGVCLISGGEFACPVRGNGVGGRSAETALRCAFEFERMVAGGGNERGPSNLVALCAGTDGVDGNSPAAGALCDQATNSRVREVGLDPQRFLDESDAYTLFDTLGDAIVTGPTGTNVRDLRIMLAG